MRRWLKGRDKEVLLVRRILTNKDGSTGVLNLVSCNVTLDDESAAAIYQKRWKVEPKLARLHRLVPRIDAIACAMRSQLTQGCRAQAWISNVGGAPRHLQL